MLFAQRVHICIDQQVCTGYVSGVPEFWFICFSESFAFLKELAGSL